MTTRTERLQSLAITLVDGIPIFKLDLIALIHIDGYHVLNVYRRYNNVLNIVVECTQSDEIYFFSDRLTLVETIRQLYGLPLYPNTIHLSAQMYSFSFQATLHNYGALEYRTWNSLISEHAAAILHLEDRDHVFWRHASVPVETPIRPRTMQAIPAAPLQDRSAAQHASREDSMSEVSCRLPFEHAEKRTWSQMDTDAADAAEEEEAAEVLEYLLLRNGRRIPRSWNENTAA